MIGALLNAPIIHAGLPQSTRPDLVRWLLFQPTDMARAVPPTAVAGIFDIPMPGNWVMPGDRLWLALVKPPYNGPQLIENDTTRPGALALADRLFAPDGAGQFPVATNAQDRNAVVLFPEFAFGSGDFAHLDALIRAQPHPVVVLAGFGATRGDALRAAIQAGAFQCGWTTGLASIDDTKRYNGAWCWIRDPRQHGANAHRCFALLKNWPEQRNERVGIPDIASGTEIARLIADDCTIFPLICSDVLCNAPNSPQVRIATSVQASNLDHFKVLVPVLMLDANPANPAWSSRLAHLIQADPEKMAVVTCNHVSVRPLPAEDEDQMRCLSGALVSIQQCSTEQKRPSHPVRPLSVAGFAGYVLRSSAPGIAGGEFVWREIPLSNRFVWLPNLRATLDAGAVTDTIASPDQIEMQRWCSRVRPPAWLNAGSPGLDFLANGFEKLLQALKVSGAARTIWPDALVGRGLDDKFSHPLDSAGRIAPVRDALDEAYRIASSAIQSPAYRFEPLATPGHFHRPAFADRAARDIVIWSSPNKLSDHQYKTVQEEALKGRFARATVVVAHGAGGTPPAFKRVTPDATTDIANGPPAGDATDIAEPPVSPVFWMPSGELHPVLLDPSWLHVPEPQRLDSIALAIENLFNRAA